MPAHQRARDIRKDLAVKFTRSVAFLPDQALQRLERRGLPVFAHRPVDVRQQRALIRSHRQSFGPQIDPKHFDHGPDGWLAPVRLEECGGALASVGKEDAMDEREWCGRPFDIEQKTARGRR